MNCQRAKENLALLTESDLETHLVGGICDHLETCPSCSEVAQRYRGLRELLKSHGRRREKAQEVDLWGELKKRIQA